MKFKEILQVIACVLVVLACAWMVFGNSIFKSVLSVSLKTGLGLNSVIEETELYLLPGKIGVRGLQVTGPANFPEHIMLDAPEISLDLHPLSVFFGRLRVQDCNLYLREIAIVKNKNGEINFVTLAKHLPGRPSGDALRLKIDRMHVRIDRFVYQDYSSGALRVHEYRINLNEEYKGDTDLTSLAGKILGQALAKATLSGLLDTVEAAKNEFLRAARKAQDESLSQVSDKAAELIQRGLKKIQDTLQTGK